tara:strand:- start:2372 stop:2590 length:219 start_codon:yes stop_codon:yes gene_type:complete
MKNQNVISKALKLYFGNKLNRDIVNDSESAKTFVHKWLDEVEYDSNKLAVKFLASEVRKRIDSEIDYNDLWK